MEMYSIGLKSIASLLIGNARQALGGLFGRPPPTGKGGRGVRTGAERRAENDRQRYHAQALAACWQGTRYLK